MQVFDLQQLARFDDTKPLARVITNSGQVRRVLFAFRAGQGLAEHSASGQIAVQVIAGRLTFAAEGERHELMPGHLLTLDANVQHSVQAESDAVMLLTITADPQR